MKRMNVRAFRKDISSLTEEPIEVVRYSETIGFWVPQGLTLEPRTKPRVSRSTRKPKVVSRGTSPISLRDDELAELGRKIREIAKRVGTL